MNKHNIKVYFEKTPQETLKETYNKIPKNVKWTIIATFVFGIIVHLYALTNNIVNHDGTLFLICDTDAMIWGRWFRREAAALSGIFQLPLVIGILSIAVISLSAAFTVSILDIKNTIFCSITGMVMVSVPIIASIFSFMFTADAYAISLFLSVLCVFFAKKKGLLNSIMAIAFLVFSTAVYQAYCQFALTLFVILILLEVIIYESNLADIVKKGIKYCVIFASGILIYRVILLGLNKLNGTENSFASLTITENFINRIRTVLSLFRRSMVEFRGIYGYEVVKYIYIGAILLSICFITVMIWKHPKGKKLFRLCFAGVLFCCIPVAQNILIIMTDTRVHNLTRYAFILSVLLILKLIDMIEESVRKNIYRWCVILASVIVLWCNFLFTNECYLSLQLTDMTSYAFANRIVDRIETTPGWEEDMPVMIIGNLDKAYDAGAVKDTKPILHHRIEDVMGIVRLDWVYYTPYYLYMYINDYIGKPLTKVTEEEIERIQKSGEVERMGNFPASDSVKIIDGVMVVKLYDGAMTVEEILGSGEHIR